MKKFFLTIASVIIAVITFAQTPEMLNYQAVVRNSSGDLIKSTSVSFRISILQATETGTAIYTETHNATTNTQGLVNLKIGNGTSTDVFANINWAGNKYFLKVEMDPAGGTTYSHYSTSQLLSVPYALYAKQAETVPNSAITTAKINDNAVTAAKINTNAVTTTKILNSAVTAAKIADEPGIAFVVAHPLNTFRDMPSAITSIDSITITVPAGGYVYVTSSLSVKINHTTGSNDEAQFQLMPTRNSRSYTAAGFVLLRVPGELPTSSNYIYPVHLSKVFTVAAAGTYKFYLYARMFSGSDTGDVFYNAQMSAMYFPTAYGTVFE